MEGITFRRPRIGDINMTKEMLKIDSGNLVFVHGVLEGAKTKPTEGFKEPAGSCGAMVRGNLKMEDVSCYLSLLSLAIIVKVCPNLMPSEYMKVCYNENSRIRNRLFL